MNVLPKKNHALSFFTESVLDQKVVNFWVQKFNPTWSTHEMLGRIVKKQNTAKDMVTLTIRCNKRMNFGLPGQHHPVIVEIAARRLERTYSLNRIDEQHVELTLKKVPQGAVSTWLCHVAEIGDIVEFGQPYGEMLCVTHPEKEVILLAAGSGITPMYSMVYDLAKTGRLVDYRLKLMYWVKRSEDLAFHQFFQKTAQQYPQFSYETFCTQEGEAASRLSESHVNDCGDLHETAVFACGPSGFVNSACDLFHVARLFKSEAFTLSPLEVSDTGTVTITLTKSQKMLEVPRGISLLDALERANEKPVSGCRMGICNKCSCHKVSGVTQNILNQNQNAEPGSSLRICINSAKSDLVLDL
ncbi:flavin reductase family protein [Acinetobacter rathckeae]|uniref:flavin reductase family protein n=1 Tax=Acinetobacter rathckeae TaxID=2605272 RepID=UPI0018A2CFE9|nr:iron-sulfur cluster-binding domain-containing protein [Acinetobacter rathckeae]MBF7686896.1 iron-sulfur cluster-binding domain-containing protein [Acinetobacter rathckeae]